MPHVDVGVGCGVDGAAVADLCSLGELGAAASALSEDQRSVTFHKCSIYQEIGNK